MSGRTLIVFGDSTADEIVSSVARGGTGPWGRVEKVYFDAADPDEIRREWDERGELPEFIVGIADVRMRKEVAERAVGWGWRPAVVVDSTAVVDPSAQIGAGCFVAAQAVVSCRAVVGAHCLIHFNCTVGHDAQVGDYSVILPGGRISGHVELGAQVLIGSNAFVFQGVRVGARAAVDALTYVREDVADGRVVSGRRNIPQ